MAALAFVLILAGATSLVLHGRARSRIEVRVERFAPPGRRIDPASTAMGRVRALVTNPVGLRPSLLPGVCAAAGSIVGLRLAGPPGAILGLGAGVAGLRLYERRRRARTAHQLEHQLAELVEACALAVRGGASVSQAVVIASQEVEEPMRSMIAQAVEQQRLGSSFEEALHGLSTALENEDARLFTLVMTIHHRSGGSVAGPLGQVATTIRHRLAVRRELGALTAQGRISGTVLGVLPVAFFLVLSATSHRELAPVYRSPAGASMIIGGLILEGLAYLWIRHLLKVEG